MTRIQEIFTDLIFPPLLKIDFSDDPKNNLVRIDRVVLRNKIARAIWLTYASVTSLILLWLTIFAFGHTNLLTEQLFEDVFVLLIVSLFRPKKFQDGFLHGLEQILLVRDFFSDSEILKKYWNAVVDENRYLHKLEILAATKLMEKRISSQKIP